jgi:tetratricopeptide (TPR) repeat protein
MRHIMKRIHAFAAAAVVVGGLFSLSAPAFAIGSGRSDRPECPRGQVYDQQKQQCVQAESGVVDDQSLVDYAYLLARDGQYQAALDTLDLMENSNTAEALNYRGYATRNLGRVDEGIGYYQQAVALDPEYTLVREYLGEAYVIQGKLDLAREQLGEIEKRCGTTCEPYVDLAEAIEEAI